MTKWTSRIPWAVSMCISVVWPGPATGQEHGENPQQAVYGDIDFQGNRAFSRAQLLGELSRKTDLCSLEGTVLAYESGCRLLESNLLAGYHASGYPEAKIRVAMISGRLVAAIEEGPVYRMAEVRVTGPELSSNALFAEIISSEIIADQSVSDEEDLTTLSRLSLCGSICWNWSTARKSQSVTICTKHPAERSWI